MSPLDRDVLLLCIKEQKKTTAALNKLAILYREEEFCADLEYAVNGSEDVEHHLDTVRMFLNEEPEEPIKLPVPLGAPRPLTDFIKI